MSSEKQTRGTQVSLCDSPVRRQRSVSFHVPSRCSDGHGTCNPCPLHPVSTSLCVRCFTSPDFLGLAFSMPTQRAQSGSTVIVSYFPTGMPSQPLSGYLVVSYIRFQSRVRLLDRMRDLKPTSPRSCALQYIVLHLLGYKLSLDDLKAFRQIDSLTPGHPEARHTDGEKPQSLWCYVYTYTAFRNRSHHWTPWPGYLQCRWLGNCAGAFRGGL